ncbi:hypothetical protein ASPZODRAFT_132630 [Penicilliopsis zonata CBS 506.65]|uniref:MIF4G domain-containing protein n=1 Tax=Penicilliopsis zonata CBS 506.65 TaxID=1073090 RepID=A0A1L9SHG3_9EURO|nr:hypothetical protein ASPZODRAFT_132630 [Penicilliopsis zonata CBS 506.65]OJJ46561.1 hypothetical protein ASPZODRAFT_132630 [Penicilliopsis zonata CBS 506.65]
MTSIPQKPGAHPAGQSSASPSASGKSTPLAPATTTTTARSYASATKKDGPAASPVSMQQQQQQQQQQQLQQQQHVTIVNGAPAAADHSRKPSVTITSAGASGVIPNGQPSAASRPSNLQFGFANPQSSPNMGSPAVLAQQPGGLTVSSPNPRVVSPQTSPSPIPQPASSGGRPPPSSYQGNAPNFGSFGDEMRAPQSHLRRESAQSTHSDVGSQMGGRPGYPHQGGRGRGYSQSGYQGQMPYGSPGPTFRQTPNQPRGAPPMGPQFHNQGRPLAPPFPNSPHQANRSPALANAHPVTPNMNPVVPMAHAQMPYGSYGQHMGPQTTYPHAAAAYDHTYGYYNPAAYGMPQAPYMAPPSPQPRPGMPYNQQGPYLQNQYPVQPPPQAAPLSRSPSQLSTDRPGSSLGGQGPAGAAAVAGAPNPAVAVAAGGHAHSASRGANSPAPPKTHFVIPSAKKSVLVIKDPSGAVKTFDKTPASPARATPSPVKITTPSATPPPSRSADHARSDSKVTKTDEEKKKELRDAVLLKISQDEAEQRRKAEEEENKKKKQEQEQREAAEKEAAEQEAAARKKQEEEEAAARKQKEEEEAAAAAAAAKKAEEEEKAEAARKAMEELSLKQKAEEEEKAKADADADAAAAAAAAAEAEAAKAKEAPAADDEIDFDAIEREMAELEAKEAAAEAEYYARKKAQKEDQERKEREEREAWENNMKQAEREAEALEEAKMKGSATTGDDDASRKEREELFASLKKGGLGGVGTPATDSPADSGVATPASDMSSSMLMGPPAKPVSALKRDKPAALKLETNKAVEPPQPSAAMKALQSARFLDDLSSIAYPPSVVSPNPALNANAPADRRFHYNKEFLLQFQAVFKEKPSIDWDARVRETVGDSDSSRPQSARTPMLGPRHSSRPGASQSFGGPMGGFTQPPRPMAMPNQGIRQPSMGGGSPFGSFGGRPGGLPMGPGSGLAGGSRSSSTRGGQRDPSRASRGGGGGKKPSKKEGIAGDKDMPLTANMKIEALQISTTGWKARSLAQAPGPVPGGEGHLAPDVVQRKVKAALNKMTPENFDRISGQILEIVSQSKDESDGRTLRQVIQLTFEKATDEAHWAPMYAKFCKCMLESMSPEIKDENIRDKNGNVVAGGSLFRKYLLNRCQEEFERGWKINLPPKPEGVTEEIAMMSDEYYTAAAAKRRGLGLVKFIGELYKLGMLTERIMHECVKKLVDYEGTPDEAEVESLTSLLRTIGGSLDASERGHTFMDAYFSRINMMVDIPDLPSRLRFMLMDIIDLRNARWKSKDADKGPKTINEIREEAARAAQEAEMERIRQQASRGGGGGGGRPPMGRGDARSFSSGGFGGQGAPPQDFASSKVGTDDLRRLRATPRNTNQLPSFGPSSMLGSRSSSGRKNFGPGGNLVRGSDDSAASSRNGASTPKKDDKEAASSINAFSALAALDDNMATSPPSNPTSPMLTKSQPADRRPSKDMHE